MRGKQNDVPAVYVIDNKDCAGIAGIDPIANARRGGVFGRLPGGMEGVEMERAEPIPAFPADRLFSER